MAQSGCLNDAEVLRFARGELEAAAADAVEVHIAACAYCRSVVAEAAKFLFEQRSEPGGADDASTAELPAGTRVSRYVIAEPIGAGASGRVFRAFDPHLGRSVALKLVRSGDGQGAAEQQARVLREAQAMAKLSHPNVVNVFDAGTFGPEIFIVMELVEGETLTAWLGRARRSAAEILHAFAEAGRGLAAAHEVGLVHRDFKPDNVLVGRGGRVRVTDFGLARVAGPVPASDDGRAPGDPGASTIAGTPAYMAPEQFRRGPSDARTDQFSFCVALYTALYGQRPFGAEASTVARHAAEVLAGRLRPPPARGDVPERVRRALVRGLAARAEDRHPSMAALLGELVAPAVRAAGRGRRTTTLAIAAAGVVAAIVLARPGTERNPGALARCGDGRPQHPEECDDGNASDDDGCSASCLRCGGDGRSFAGPGGHCYTRYDEALTWKQAADACHARGEYLVTYATEHERAAVHAALLRARPATYWINMRVDPARGERSWLPREAAERAFPAWAEAPPPPGGLCGASDPRTHDGSVAGGWAIAPCAEPRGYVCERNPWLVFPGNGHAYRAIAVRRSWGEAARTCEALGAHLVTIADEEENRFIRSEFTGRFWLGARKAAGGEPFRWVDGAPLGFTAFRPGEPDQAGAPSCVVLDTDRLWHDRPCDGADRPPDVLCEVDR